MRSLVLLSLALYVTCTFVTEARAQQTTDEEWLYLTKGIHSTYYEQGLSLKPGYAFRNKTEHLVADYKISIEEFYRTQDGTLAAHMLIVLSPISRKTYRIPIRVGAEDQQNITLYEALQSTQLDIRATRAVGVAFLERCRQGK